MTSQEEKRKQRTRRNVLISLPQSPEAFSGPGGVIPRHALSKAQTLGEKRIVTQCLATGSVVLLVGNLLKICLLLALSEALVFLYTGLL